MDTLAFCLTALVDAQGTEILYNRGALAESLADVFSNSVNRARAFEKCLEIRFFPHAYYKTNINEILFMRQKTICDLVDGGESREDAEYVVDGFTRLAEHLRGIQILSRHDKKNDKPYELLSAALRSYEKGNYRPAIMAFNSLASADVAESHYYLGKSFYEGKGVAQDYTKAAKSFFKGFQAGLSGAVYHYGTCLLKGQGVQKNVEQGMGLLIKAAEMGQEDAAFAVGYMYKDSAKDIKKAIECLQMSADYGNWSAAITLCDLYYEDAKTTGNFHKTTEARNRIGRVTDPESCYKIAQIYERGIGVPINLEKALNYSTKAATKGHKAAAEMMTRVGNKKLGRA